jgi:hypothetical protein
MSDGIIHNPTPQFRIAEYLGLLGNDHCQFCHQPITGTYYRVNESMACSGCAEKVRGELAKTPMPHMRAVFCMALAQPSRA